MQCNPNVHKSLVDVKTFPKKAPLMKAVETVPEPKSLRCKPEDLTPVHRIKEKKVRCAGICLRLHCWRAEAC